MESDSVSTAGMVTQATARRVKLVQKWTIQVCPIADHHSFLAQLKAKISKLEGALQAAHARMAEDCRGAGIDASMTLSSPTPGSPLPWTPTNGTLKLPEIGLTPGDEDEALDQTLEEPQRRIPKSDSNFDLRTAAATPRESRGLGRESRQGGMADVRNPSCSSAQCAIASSLTQKLASQLATCRLAHVKRSNQSFALSVRPSQRLWAFSKYSSH